MAFSVGCLPGLQRLHCVVCANCEQLGQGCRGCEPQVTSPVPLSWSLWGRVPLHARTRFPLSTFCSPSLRQGQSFSLGLCRHHVLAWLPRKLGVLDPLLAPSTSCPSLCPHKVTGPSFASAVKDENPTSAQAVPCALAHPFSCRGFQQSLQGSSAVVWGSGMLAGSRAGYLHWYQQLHRDGILHPFSPLLPREVSHPIAGWLLRVAVLLWMVASATVRMLYLTWDTWEQGKGATSPPYQTLPWHMEVSSAQDLPSLPPCHT